jgi:hypothetical protein
MFSGATDPASPKLAALRRVAQRAVLDRMLLLYADKEAAPEVRSLVAIKMNYLRVSAHTC